MDRTLGGTRYGRLAFTILAVALACSPSPCHAAVVPTADPGGFEIEGDLIANSPTADVSDWLPQGSGKGAGVLDAAGHPLYPIRTFHLTDAFDTSDDVFQTGSNQNTNPNLNWHWVQATAVPSRNYNHVLVYVVPDANGHQWLLLAVDRKATTLTTVVSVELLQGTLSANPGGTFTSSGGQGGRTVGDMLLTFVLDPSLPSLSAARWLEGSPGSFDFAALAPLPANQYAVAMNTAKPVDVPYGAYGSLTYPPNQFAEMAIDLASLDGPSPVTFHTLFVTNRSTVSFGAALGDFVAPLSLNLPLAAVESAERGLALRLLSSNPASGAVRFEVVLPTATHVDLRLFDVSGRDVERLVSGTFASGPHTVSWRPSSRGHLAGLYFARLTAAGRSVTRRIIIAP